MVELNRQHTAVTVRTPWLATLRQQRAIAVIRTDSLELNLQLASLAIAGGLQLVEITWNSAQAGETITELRRRFPHGTIGTGTVLDEQDLQRAIASGAQFCFTPHTNPKLVNLALDKGIPIIPGALSPTEIVQAWQAGASAVKVFPVQSLGGVDYIKALQGPLGSIPLIPTGGVTLYNALPFLNAGAIAVGLAGQLFPPELVKKENWLGIEARIQHLLQLLAKN